MFKNESFHSEDSEWDPKEYHEFNSAFCEFESKYAVWQWFKDLM